MTKTKDFFPEGWLINTAQNKKALSSVATLNTAILNGDILEGNVILCDGDHNLFVDLGCMKGIIPKTEGAIGIDTGAVRDIALISRVGKPVSFVINDIINDNSGTPMALLSRKSAQEKFLDYFFKEKSCGSVINARITHLENFGAFCDIGCGVIALLPIDAISISRISHPCDRFSPGDDLKAVVKSISEDNKITLTHKELLGSWEENVEAFKEGQTVSGIVRSVESYGIFVELAPNLAGLAEPKAGVLPGMSAGVYIKSIIKEKMKIKLIIIDSFEKKLKTTPKYYFNGDYMDFWRYSPLNSTKNIYTDFLSQ